MITKTVPIPLSGKNEREITNTRIAIFVILDNMGEEGLRNIANSILVYKDIERNTKKRWQDDL